MNYELYELSYELSAPSFLMEGVSSKQMHSKNLLIENLDS